MIYIYIYSFEVVCVCALTPGSGTVWHGVSTSVYNVEVSISLWFLWIKSDSTCTPTEASMSLIPSNPSNSMYSSFEILLLLLLTGLPRNAVPLSSWSSSGMPSPECFFTSLRGLLSMTNGSSLRIFASLTGWASAFSSKSSNSLYLIWIVCCLSSDSNYFCMFFSDYTSPDIWVANYTWRRRAWVTASRSYCPNSIDMRVFSC